jgi:hypothetical protein
MSVRSEQHRSPTNIARHARVNVRPWRHRAKSLKAG